MIQIKAKCQSFCSIGWKTNDKNTQFGKLLPGELLRNKNSLTKKKHVENKRSGCVVSTTFANCQRPHRSHPTHRQRSHVADHFTNPWSIFFSFFNLCTLDMDWTWTQFCKPRHMIRIFIFVFCIHCSMFISYHIEIL